MCLTVLTLFLSVQSIPIITEVMANPLDEATGEYVEVYNPTPEPLCILDFTITDGDALDDLLAWDEILYGEFPQSDVVTGTDTIPAFGSAILFETGYINNPVYDIEPGTVILTTGDLSICNGLSASSDPLTLFDEGGTGTVDVESTYGTPEESENWEDRDDDGLDDIPFDPGDGISVERIYVFLPDTETNWCDGPEGGTPGWFSQPPDSFDISVTELLIQPENPLPDQIFNIQAVLTNTGLFQMQGGMVTVFLDNNVDSLASPDELIAELYSGSIEPGFSDTLQTQFLLPSGCYLLAAQLNNPDDQNESNNFLYKGFLVGDGIPSVISEVYCNPTEEDYEEFIELYYPGPGVFNFAGCSFTDGDALDVVSQWSNEFGEINDEDVSYGFFLSSGGFAVILDPEYPLGPQSFDFPEGTLVLTAGNTTLGNGLSGNDPVTFYNNDGTCQENVLSTYGTPIASDDPMECDDDGLDGIPFDPGNGHSVERIDLSGPDEESNWMASIEDPSPGSSPEGLEQGIDAEAVSLLFDPPMGVAGDDVSFIAGFDNAGTELIENGQCSVIIFTDFNLNRYPDEGETVYQGSLPEIAPFDTVFVNSSFTAIQNRIDVVSTLVCTGDTISSNDTLSGIWNPDYTVVINEILYHPPPALPEWIEIYNTGDPVDLNGWIFSDSRTGVVFCPENTLLDSGCFAVITSDSTHFLEAWPDCLCKIFQPPQWPVLNDFTQQGEEWADNLTLSDGSMQLRDWVPYDDSWGGGNGLSLERINPEQSGFTATGWGTCLNSSGSTPGDVNSLFSEIQAGGPLMNFSPNPFSPDGDGVDDMLRIDLNLPSAQNIVTLSVYNIQGRLLLNLLESESTGSFLTVYWDGSDSEGRLLTLGRYILHLTSTQVSGGETSESTRVVVLAKKL